MPLYEYACEACSHRFEKIQKFSDEPIKVCPKCGGPVEKLLSSPAIQFKGSGWYITDYARAGKGDRSTPAGKSQPDKQGTASSEASTTASESKGEKAAPSSSTPAKAS